VNFNTVYSKAMSYNHYVENLGEYASLHHLHYRKFSIEADLISQIRDFKPIKILVITEPWCGDSLALLPIVRKIAEANSQWELRVLRRDDNPEIMENFLTDGTKSIPIFIFLDEQGEIVFKWGPRPKSAYQIFENHREQIKQGYIEKQEVIKKIRTFYAKDRGRSSFRELFEICKHHLN
jgi:thioredoxin-like negative regulator of GroEL